MPVEFETPADPQTLLRDFAAEHQLRAVPSLPENWSAKRTIHAGLRTPVITQGNGSIRVVDAVWGHEDPETKAWVTSIDAGGTMSAWSCLIPMTACHLEPDTDSMAASDGCHGDGVAGPTEWFMAAGFLRPETVRNPTSVVILRHPRLGIQQPWQPLVIGRQHWLIWIDPAIDTRWLHGMSGSNSLVRA